MTTDTVSITKTKKKTKALLPRKYLVFLLNDDYTTMEFVVEILETIFSKAPAEAVSLMLEVHNKGKALCGSYTKEIAEAKVELVHTKAKEAEYPLRCFIEPEEGL